MNAQTIEKALSELKVNAKGHIRGKNRVIDKINAQHLVKLDSELMDIRIFIYKLENFVSAEDLKEEIDVFIHKKQILL